MSIALPAPYRLLRGNGALSRIVCGEGFSSLADWLLAVVLTVVVYRISRSGTTVALLSFARLAPYGLVLPWSGLALDRGNRRLLFASLGIGRSLCMLGLLVVDSQVTLPLVFPLVFASSSLSCLLRPAINATLPNIVTEDDTVVANSLVSQVDGAAHIIGPALGGAFILGGAPRLALVVAALSFLLSGAALYFAPTPNRSRPTRSSSELSLAEVLAGFRYILRENERVLIALTLTAAGLALVAGAYYALAVVLCVRTFHLGGQGVGWLDATYGLGNVAGSLALGLAIRGRRVVRVFAAGAALSSLGVALLAVSPPGPAPFACIILVGLASVAVQVTGTTILQAAAPQDMLGRVFTAFEATLVVATLLGALAVGPLLRLTSPRGATLAFAFAGAVVFLISLPLLRGLEDVLGLRVFLRSVPLLAELPRPLLDELAPRFDAVTFPAGAAIIREGEPGDRFYVIRDGEVVVSIGGRVIRTLGPAAYFGEVALLRDVPRTASVSAASEAELYSLDRAAFDALMRQTDGLWTRLSGRAETHYIYASSALLRH